MGRNPEVSWHRVEQHLNLMDVESTVDRRELPIGWASVAASVAVGAWLSVVIWGCPEERRSRCLCTWNRRLGLKTLGRNLGPTELSRPCDRHPDGTEAGSGRIEPYSSTGLL